MDNIVSALITGVDSMFQQPHGCGEQTMVYTAPIVYGMYYIKQTGQETAENEKKGTDFLRFGKHLNVFINIYYFVKQSSCIALHCIYLFFIFVTVYEYK